MGMLNHLENVLACHTTCKPKEFGKLNYLLAIVIQINQTFAQHSG